jgi:hypothetical protein
VYKKILIDNVHFLVNKYSKEKHTLRSELHMCAYFDRIELRSLQLQSMLESLSHFGLSHPKCQVMLCVLLLDEFCVALSHSYLHTTRNELFRMCRNHKT